MTDRSYTPKKQILLTGAGFSKPFGGYLASEMWAAIFNKVNTDRTHNVRTLLRGELNYEAAYDSVMSGPFSAAEKEAFSIALVEAYGALDRSIQSRMGGSPPLKHALRAFITQFKGEENQRGFIFTLNQDLLLERFFHYSDAPFQIPAPGQHPDWFTSRMDRNTQFEANMPLPARLQKFQEQFWRRSLGLSDFVYVKLHGSYGWRSSTNNNAMVIGHNKSGDIAKEPLLKWYLAFFQEVLNYGDQILVVAGYGFMDEHINGIIADAAKTNLQLHMVSPMQPKDLESHLWSRSSKAGGKPVPRGQEIWQMLSGYHCTSAEQIFAQNADALREDFLNSVGLS